MNPALADRIAVVTCTLGDSCGHLSRSLTELRQFTKVPFRQLVSDDGTADRSVCDRQRAVCEAHGAEWVENPGPVFGVSYNLNSVFQRALDRGCEWVFVIEDAVRPSMGWLETALDALERVGLRQWNGHRIAALGMATSFENWHLAGAGILPGSLGLGETFAKFNQEIYDEFWGCERYPGHWNDGYWCWKRLEPGTLAACQSPEAAGWPEIIKRTWQEPVLRHEIGGMYWTGHPFQCWQHTSGWPRTRGVSWAMGPSAWALHNLECWQQAGGFLNGCTFYEGAMGVKYAQQGFLSVNCECPPWLHMSGLAFRVKDGQREPRHHEPPDGPGGILERTFGVNGPDHVDLAALARSFFPPGELDDINRQLAGIQLHMEEGWSRWA